MKVRITETIATPTINYQRGRIYDMEDAEAKRLIAAGQATDDLTEKGAVQVPKPPKRQIMDRKTGTPVENIAPLGINPTQPSQTAAGTERQAAQEIDTRHAGIAPPIHTGTPTAGTSTLVDATSEAAVATDAGKAGRRRASDAKPTTVKRRAARPKGK